MADTESRTWIRVVVVGAVYFVVGYGSTLLDHPFSGQVHFWRLAAWVASGIIYLTHVTYEYFSLRNSPATTATNVALAVALGGLLLAVAATTHALMVSEHASYARLMIAWIAWPLITGVPAFVVTILLTTVLRLLRIPRPRAT